MLILSANAAATKIKSWSEGLIPALEEVSDL